MTTKMMTTTTMLCVLAATAMKTLLLRQDQPEQGRMCLIDSRYRKCLARAVRAQWTVASAPSDERTCPSAASQQQERHA